MKRIGFLFCGLLAASVFCEAQPITTAGWFNANPLSRSILVPTQGVSEAGFTGMNGSISPLGVPGQTNIAEEITPGIQSLAQGLENDPLRIFDYVHDHIRHELYFGSKKGAQMTLLEKSGNDFDQCALLVALLQAAGYTNVTYQLGLLQMPYDSQDQNDLRHWLRLSLVNTNWSNTVNFLEQLLVVRGYPLLIDVDGNNTVAFHRVWVTLTIGGTNYILDPAFKVSETSVGINLATAMGLDVNGLLNAAAGTDGGYYVQGLQEGPVRNKLRDYTTNLLFYLKTNCPNASVDQILGGQQISPWTNGLAQGLLFSTNTQYPVVSWNNVPTNLMSTLSISFANTNCQWFVPAIQGQRLSLTYSSTGLAELWQDDTRLVQATTTASDNTVVLGINHPFGTWNPDNTLNDNGDYDQIVTNYYQRTNATYVILCAFDAGPDLLRQRQNQLDAYFQQGLTNTSRQVVSETLNVMGLSWLYQTKLAERLLAVQEGMLPQWHHRLGRMAQEQGNGHYVDAYMQYSGLFMSSGAAPQDYTRSVQTLDMATYFASAFEHAIIEQSQSGSLVGASTIKMLELASTNNLKIYLANYDNWTPGGTQVPSGIRNLVTNYSYPVLDSIDGFTFGGTLLLPENGSQPIAGGGSYAGYGVEGRLVRTNSQSGAVYESLGMLIGGGYNGGYSGEPIPANSGSVYAQSPAQTTYFGPSTLSTPPAFNLSGDPVNMADGSVRISATDLSLGQAEPTGLALTRYYTPTMRRYNQAGLGNGWTHSYYFNLKETSASEAGLGGTTPAQAAPMLAATCAALNLYNQQPDPKNWMVCVLIAKWGIDQLIRNAVSITLGQDTLEFIKQPDGSFTPPANCPWTLTKSSTYALKERHGRTFNFNGNNQLTSITNPYGNSLTLTYGTGSSSNWVTQATDWKNRTLTFTYSGTPTRLGKVTDNSSPSRTVFYNYSTNSDNNLDLISVADPEGKTNRFNYDANHQMVATVNALGQLVVSNIYDGFGRVVTQFTQGDTNKTWQYFWSGFANAEQDPAGNKRRYFYDDKTRQIANQDALGNFNSTFYDGQDHVVMTVSPLNETNQLIYDGNHNLIQAIDPLGFSNQFVYDSKNNLIQSVDGRGNPSSFGYNAQFSLTSSTNGAGDWVTYAFNTDGTLHTRTDPGGATTNGYDSYGQLNSITYPGGLGGESFVNSLGGDVTSHTDARGFITTYAYNSRRQLTNTVAPTNLTTRIAYDAVGNVSSTTDARGLSTTNTWSATRKLLATILPATPQGVPVITNVYDGRDWLVKSLDPLQQPTLYTNDAAERLISATDPLLRTIRFGFDADGRKTATTNAALEVTRQVWNPRSEPIQTIDNRLSTINRGFDAAGNQIILTNRNGKQWQFQFDAANRLTNTITPLNRQTTLTFDNRGLLKTVREPSGQIATNFYDSKGRLTNRVDGVASTLFGFDANDNRTNVVENGKTNSWTFDAYDRVTSYKDADGNLIQYRYDANGNVTNLIYPGGRTVVYFYDSLNRLTNVTDWASRQTRIEYDLASRVKKITRPNGTMRLINYDVAGETTNIIEQAASRAPIAFFTLNWNSAARVQWEFAGPLPHTNPPPWRSITFDDDNQLASINGLIVVNDLDGNMTTGPLTKDATLVNHSYDARNRLVNVGGTGAIPSLSYGYDPAGNRTAVTNGASVTKFVINPNAKLSQALMRIKNGVTNYYVYGAGLLYQVTETAAGTNTLTYHFDYRGSTVALTDDGGNVTDRIEYSAYARRSYRSGANDTPFQYNGRYGVMTDDNGLLYMRARYYNPLICRFLNPDPTGFNGGLNFYAAFNGNPVSYRDPSGRGAVGDNQNLSRLTGASTTPANLSNPFGVGASNSGLNFETTSTVIGGFGVANDVVQYGSGTASIGSNLRIYTSGWGGNQYVPTAKIGGIAETAAGPLAAVSIGMDAYGLSQGNISGEKFAVNTGFTAIGYFGGLAGAIIAGEYFLTDTFYPGGVNGYMNDSANTLQENMKLAPTTWSLMYPIIGP